VDGCEILHHLGWLKPYLNIYIYNGINMDKPSTGAGFHWPLGPSTVSEEFNASWFVLQDFGIL